METIHQPPLFARKNAAYAGAAFCCLLWGSAYPAIKSGYEIFQIDVDDIPRKSSLLAIASSSQGYCYYCLRWRSAARWLASLSISVANWHCSGSNLTPVRLLLYWSGLHHWGKRFNYECDGHLL
jgi:hypothetical protein